MLGPSEPGLQLFHAAHLEMNKSLCSFLQDDLSLWDGMGESGKGFPCGVQISVKVNSVECCGLEFNQLQKIIL